MPGAAVQVCVAIAPLGSAEMGAAVAVFIFAALGVHFAVAALWHAVVGGHVTALPFITV